MTETKRYAWLRELQLQVGKWSSENFGTEQPPEYPLIGAGEEIGELTTSVLKRAQGIDDSEKYADRVGPEAEKDAIGDIVIYLLDAMYRIDGNVSLADGFIGSESILEYDMAENDVEVIRLLYEKYGKLSGTELISYDSDGLTTVELYVGEVGSLASLRLPLRQPCLRRAGKARSAIGAVAEVVAVLSRLCEVRGYDFQSCVIDAWEEVSGRKWDAEIAQA